MFREDGDLLNLPQTLKLKKTFQKKGKHARPPYKLFVLFKRCATSGGLTARGIYLLRYLTTPSAVSCSPLNR